LKVFVTGASGFIGAHTTLALLKNGHSVRLLLRNPDPTQKYFAEQGYQVDDIVCGDMLDQALIERSLEGCDAVLHAAALVSLDKRQEAAILDNNIQAIDSVIDTACKLGIQNIVYVSSLVALFNPKKRYAKGLITEANPIQSSNNAYSKSKSICEEKVRKLQEQGFPIQITYPCGVFGPNDPKLSEGNKAVTTFCSSVIPITSSGIQCVDVRDLANAQCHLLENKPCLENPPNYYRFIVAGNFYSWKEFHYLFEKVTQQKIKSAKMPGCLMRLTGRLIDGLGKLIPLNTPVSYEAMLIVSKFVPASSKHIQNHCSVNFRSLDKTLQDTLPWLIQAGHLDKKYMR